MFFRRIWFNATHVALLFLLSVLSSIGNAQDGVLGWDKRVVHGTLDNGFQYYLFDSRQEEDAPKGLTMANLVVLSGAIDEEENQLGVAKGLAKLKPSMAKQIKEHAELVATMYSYVEPKPKSEDSAGAE